MSIKEAMKRTYVGSLACQRDSFLLDGFRTTVVSTEAVESKDKKKGEQKYHVELEDTILFPEGGGQPSDTGILKIIDGDGDQQDSLSVDHVSRSGLHAKHHVNHYVKPGTKVEVLVDAKKRVDYMQQHTGQHLLSAILEQTYHLDTLSWSMGGILGEKKTSLEMNDFFNYIEIPRKLSNEEIEELSESLNDYITLKPQEIKVREAEQNSGGDVTTSKIPADYDLSKGILRTIHIGSLDENPCCGTHLTSTSQIGAILISPSQTTVRGTNSRLYFMCGRRVSTYGRLANEVLFKAKAALSCSESQIPDKITKQKEQLQKVNKREQFWMRELANIQAAALTKQLMEHNRAYLLKDDYGTLEYLLQVFKEVSNASINMSEHALVLCGREKQSEVGSLIILSDSGDIISSISQQLSSLLKSMRGGGGKKGGKWQGKIMKFTDSEWAAVEKYLETDFLNQTSAK